MIRSVIFDIDGVLIDSFEANLKFFQDVMRHAGYPPLTREDFEKVFFLPTRDVLRTMARGVRDEEIEKAYAAVRDRTVSYPISLVGYPEQMAEVIRDLNSSYLLALATSRMRASVYEVPKLAAMKSYFKVVAAYEDTVNHKPHPEPLLFAAAQLGVKPEECVYVGDAKTDVLAARAANMKIIVYSQNAIEGADRTTSLFMDLPGLINEL